LLEWVVGKKVGVGVAKATLPTFAVFKVLLASLEKLLKTIIANITAPPINKYLLDDFCINHLIIV
jgi:hypothetical protein